MPRVRNLACQLQDCLQESTQVIALQQLHLNSLKTLTGMQWVGTPHPRTSVACFEHKRTALLALIASTVGRLPHPLAGHELVCLSQQAGHDAEAVAHAVLAQVGAMRIAGSSKQGMCTSDVVHQPHAGAAMKCCCTSDENEQQCLCY
jgi:hypothetical protein